MSGIAGRTNYSEWEKKTSSLLSELENETQQEIEETKVALGQDGKYASSEAEAKEREKQAELKQKKQLLNSYQKRELGVVQVLEKLLPGNDDSTSNNVTKFITRDDIDAGKRVLNIANTNGPGNIILTQDLTNLESNIPPKTLTPKSYSQDAENDVPEETNEERSKRMINGLIKVSLTNVNDCTVALRCKVITGLLEVSHCSNLTIKLFQDSTIVTIQADICDNLNIQFNDAPSGKCLAGGHKFMYWGEDKDDRIFHAGVSNLKVGLYREAYLENETSFDFKKDGNAKAIGNASAEEVQFVTSILDGDFVTERVLRQGSATGTTVAGGVDGSGSGASARAMTAREMKEVEKQKEKIRQAVEDKLGGIKILDKDGNEVPIKNKSDNSCADDNKEDVIDEVFTSMSASDIDSIVKDCETQKTKGNEAFVAGEYAQAILLYTLVLDRAAELPDANTDSQSKQQLFPRHIVLSNRSACFLKLGHHEKALADGIEAERLDPTYVKGIFRKGLALHAIARYQEALTALSAALKIEPKNKQIKQALQFAEVRFQQEMRKRMEG